MKRIQRREFLVRSGLLAASASLFGATSARLLSGRHSEQRLVVARGPAYAAQLRRAVALAGGPAILARPGETVVVKPTLAWSRTPAEGANVHPEVLRATLEMVLEGGAERVLVFDRTSLRADFVYAKSQADRVVQRLQDRRVELLHLTEADFVPFRIQQRVEGAAAPTRSLESCLVCRYLLDADRVINVATPRHHPARRVSLGMANLLGLVGGRRPDPETIEKEHAALAALAAAVRPEVTILDATRVIVRNGPAGRGTADVVRRDLIAVSCDPVAIEAWGAQLFGLEAEDLPYLRLAETLGLGSSALGRERVIETREDA